MESVYPGREAISLPVGASQSLSSPPRVSPPPEARILPSGLNAVLSTRNVCPLKETRAASSWADAWEAAPARPRKTTKERSHRMACPRLLVCRRLFQSLQGCTRLLRHGGIGRPLGELAQ